MTPLCFIDTETTGVHPGRRVWEVAMIRRDADGERELVLQVDDVDLSNADPFGLRVGRFYDRHVNYSDNDATAVVERHVAAEVEEWTRGAHLVGLVPSFDADSLDPMLRRHHLIPAWHYHVIDVEAMAIGYIAGVGARARDEALMRDDEPPAIDWTKVAPPWKSDELSRACGVEPPTDDERHTALGDARWAMRWYDALTGGVA